RKPRKLSPPNTQSIARRITVSPSFIRYQFANNDSPKLLATGAAFVDLEQGQGRPADSAHEQMEINIACKGTLQTALNIAAWFRELISARAAARIARAAFDSAQERLQAARRKVEMIAPVLLPLLVLNGVAALVALFTEIGLTWSVLPAFLNVP